MWFRSFVCLIVSSILLIMFILFRNDSTQLSIFDPTILKSASTPSLSIEPEVKFSVLLVVLMMYTCVSYILENHLMVN